MEHVNEIKAAGRLAVKCMPKGLIFVIQVCNLISDKTLKQFMKR